MRLGLKIPCLLRVTIPDGEGKDVVGERVERLGWQGTGPREAGPIEVKGEVGGAVGPKVKAGPEENGKHEEESDGLEERADGLGAGPVGV